MEEEKQERKDWCEDTLEQLEEEIKNVNKDGINPNNATYLGEIVDIHKDLMNEYYWKEKISMYRDDYGTYSGGRSRDSRGRYMEGSYGRRGVPGSGRGRYRGHEMINDMYEDYGRYSEGKESYNRGNYGAKEDTIKSLEYMMESVVCFIDMLKQEAGPEEMDIISRYARKISEM